MTALGNARLGCGDSEHTAEITDSCCNTLYLVPQLCEGRYSAVLDDIGEAFVTLAGKNNLFDQICLGRHYLKISRNGIVEFFGPIIRLESCPTTIVARTPLWWTKRRVTTPSTSDQAYETPVQMFEDVVLYHTNNPDMGDGGFGDCEAADCDPDFSPLCYSQVYRYDGGDAALGPTQTESEAMIPVFDLLDDYAETFLDYTEVGTELFYGYRQVPIPEHRQSRPKLSQTDWCEKPRVVRDLEDFTTDAFVYSGSPDTGSLPFYRNGVFRRRVCCTKFGVHQRVFSYESLEGINEIEEAAVSQLPAYCDNRDITYIENLNNTKLDSNVQWDTPCMIPGQLVDVCIDDEYEGIFIEDTFRLIERIVEFSASNENVRITLGPVE